MINKINIHAGHGAKGSNSEGANGYFNESEVNRQVLTKLKKMLNDNGKLYNDVTINNPKNAKHCLETIVERCNNSKSDLDISIHFNSATDKNINGVECFVYSNESKAYKYAINICKEINSLGFKNRGVKINKDFKVLKTNNPCLIIECCFCSSVVDYNLLDVDKMAFAIYKGIYEEYPKRKIKPKGILYKTKEDLLCAEVLKWDKNDYEIQHIDKHYLYEFENLIVIGLGTHEVMKNKFNKENYKLLGGLNRYETLKEVLKFINK